MHLDRLQTALRYRFQRLELLEMALTHSSYSNEAGKGESYERLEFLGDSVLGLVTSHWLYQRYRDRPEGELAKLKSYLVSSKVLSRHARRFELGAQLRLGVGEERSGGRNKESIQADAMEAIFGAIYLDQGLEAARHVIEALLDLALEERSRSPRDAKTQLQEWVQARGLDLPVYRLAGESGPDHAKTFVVECLLQGRVLGKAEGGSKKLAEQAAAADALAAVQ